LVRALNEYFVGGIKTNISLFRRILSDPDFLAGKINTGYLDRLLQGKPAGEVAGEDASVAAIAAGLFNILDPAASAGVTSNGASAHGSQHATGTAASSWKRAARIESLG